jgi:hypothetical protein
VVEQVEQLVALEQLEILQMVLQQNQVEVQEMEVRL